jgi:drug/metabolite transporter (DMT)-like permease
VTLLAALVGAVLISFSAIFFALSEASPVTGAFFRMAYALPILFLLWFARRSQDRRPRSRHWIAIGAGLALAADIVAWHTSIGFIGTGLATLIANTAVIFVALGAWLIFGEKPTRATMVAIPFLLVGVTLVSGLGQGDAFGSNPVAGVVLALLSAVFYSTFLLAFRHSNDEQAPAAGPLMEATFGAAVAILLAGLATSTVELEFTLPAHAWLLVLALGAQVVAWLLIAYALPRLPAALQIVGAITVLAGVAFVAVARARKTAEPVVALPVS